MIQKTGRKNDTKNRGKKMIQKMQNTNDTKIPTVLVLVTRTSMQKETNTAVRNDPVPGY